MLVSRLPEVVFWNPWLDAYYHWVKVFCETEPLFQRGYIQHPSEIPLSVTPVSPPLNESAEPIAATKGLCFVHEQPLDVGSEVQISIVLDGTEFKGNAKVAWVEEQQGSYLVGVNFNDKNSSYGIRMAEQICHIEHYRKDVLEQQGRVLTDEEAAREWVERYASEFPATF